MRCRGTRPVSQRERAPLDLTNRFSLPVPPDQAWDLLLDFERMARAMPGATLMKVEGDRLEGEVLVKLGPMRITYQGEATVVERDRDGGRLIIEGAGKESRGSGTASMRIETVLSPAATGTVVTLHSKVDVTGRPAQMGAGMIEDVGQKLADEFATRLAAALAARGVGEGSTTMPDGGAEPDTTTPPVRKGEDVLDVGSAAVMPVLRRLVPAVVVIGAIVGIVLLIRALRG
jgi:uncharacterized protein